MLLIGAMTGCSTFHYTSTSSKRDVAECIFKGWDTAPHSAPASIADYTDYYFVGVDVPSPLPTTQHPNSVFWAEIKDMDGGSRTEYQRSFQIVHKIHDQVVVDCQKQRGASTPIPFLTSDSAEYASLEGAFAHHGAANWDDLYVEAVDDRLFIIKPIEGSASSVIAKVSPGKHDITVHFRYNRNGWPNTGTARLSANLALGKTYKLSSELEGSDYRVELYDKDTGQVISQSGTAKGSPVPPPPIIIFPPLFKN